MLGQSKGALATRGPLFAACNLLLMMCVFGVGAVDDGNVSRPLIRIAWFRAEWLTFAPARYLLKHLNVPGRTLLPDYDIVIDDVVYRQADQSQCSRELGQYICVVSHDDAPTKFVGLLGDDTPTYHAIAGPFTRPEAPKVVSLSAKARVLHVHGGDQPSLSSRALYPYNFRCLRSYQGLQSVAFHIIALNDWHTLLSVWFAEDVLGDSSVLAESLNLTNFPIFADNGAQAWAIEAWQINAVERIKRSRIRIVILTTVPSQGWQFICRVHRAQLSGLQYFIDDGWLPGWFLFPQDPALGDCTGTEMLMAALGHLRVVHQQFTPGAHVASAGVSAPPLGGDQSRLPLTCVPHLTSDDFYNSGEQYDMAVEEGFINEAIDVLKIAYFGIAAYAANAVCVALLGLHDAIYRKNVSLSSIEAREPSAFQELADSVGELDFQGTQGRFRFYPGTGDNIVSHWLVSQEGIPTRPLFTYVWTAYAEFPNGLNEAPVIATLDDENAPLIWRDGSVGFGSKPHLGEFPDCAPLNSTLVWDSCQPCPPGEFYDGLLVDCRTCPQGQFQNESGQASCYTASRGWYVPNADVPNETAQCPLGHECPRDGMVTPEPCAQGQFAGAEGQSACELCTRGKYEMSDRSSACKSCQDEIVGSSTADIASTSPLDCICPEGMYKPVDVASCKRCPAQMDCQQGSDMGNLPNTSQAAASSTLAFPRPSLGFMTRFEEPLKVYRCVEKAHCPGGSPGICAARRDPSSVACGKCLSGNYESGDDCLDCGDSGVVPFVFTIAAGIIILALVTVAINRNLHKTPASSLMIVAVAGLLCTSLQTMGIFEAIDVPWGEPVKTMLSLTTLVSFNVELLRVACVVGENPLNSFALRQLFAIGCIPLILFTLLVKKYAPKFGNPKTAIKLELCNAIGTLYSAFFISILISALNPFMCYEHPDNAGESVLSAPSLLCFEGSDHSTMIMISLIALCLVPLPFCGVCTYAIALYPSMIKKHSTSKFLLATRFLFMRYVPQRYYFQIIVLLRSLLICLMPAVLRGSTSTQVLFMSFVLGAYVVIVNTLQPWRSPQCNVLDGATSQALVSVVLCAALFIPDVPQRDTVLALASILIIGVLACMVLTATYGLWKRLAPTYYHYFICHHKAPAAAQARFLKMLLTAKRQRLRVFIDSDNLQELDTLFDTVKSRVRHLLVYLTADTLKRPWCVGEIVTALRARLQITRLHTPSFAAPSEAQHAAPDTYVDSTGCNLSEFGIEWDDVSNAFQLFLSSVVPHLELSSTLAGTERFDAVVTAVLHRVGSDGKKVQRQTSTSIQGGALIVTDPESDEASAAGGILVGLIGPEVYRICENGIALLCDMEQTASSAVRCALHAAVDIIVLSPGCLKSPDFMYILCEVMYSQENQGLRPSIISVNIPRFDFPSQAGIESLCAAFPALIKVGRTPLTECVGAFFKQISVFLATHASQHALQAQSSEIFRRVVDALTKKTSKSGSFLEGAASSTGVHGASTGDTAPLKIGNATSEVGNVLSYTSTQRATTISIGPKWSDGQVEEPKRFSWTWDDLSTNANDWVKPDMKKFNASGDF